MEFIIIEEISSEWQGVCRRGMIRIYFFVGHIPPTVAAMYADYLKQLSDSL